MSTDDKITVPVIQVVMLATAALSGRKLDYRNVRQCALAFRPVVKVDGPHPGG
jgi:hypothetical protein